MDETKCIFCGVSDQESLLLAARFEGQAGWVCPKELPRLIHG